MKRNSDISSDRIIVDIGFIRLVSVWGLMFRKFRFSEYKYDDVFFVCMALSNYHITSHPIRDNDGDAAIAFHKGCAKWKLRSTNASEQASRSNAKFENVESVVTSNRTIFMMLELLCRRIGMPETLLSICTSTCQAIHVRMLPHLSLKMHR